ncbi:MAG: sigma 54-interacting transcriptional regulator [Nitrospirae bacterium]|nr:sigma 54-interacting transcriptional regulator [Nitrospirota bacterium]
MRSQIEAPALTSIPKAARRVIERSRTNELEILYEISKAFRLDLPPHEQIRRGLHVLCQMLGHPRAVFIEQDPTTGNLRVAAGYGLTPDEKAKGKFTPGHGLVGKAFDNGGPFVAGVSRLKAESTVWNRLRQGTDEAETCFLFVPVKSASRILGLLGVEYDAASRETVWELSRLLYTMANLWGKLLAAFSGVAVPASMVKLLSPGVKGDSNRLIADSPAMKPIIEMVHRVSRVKTAVLIRGESGTGKELIARMLHGAGTPSRFLPPSSQRSKEGGAGRSARGPFVKVVCASIPETLFESELFGHEKGSFTGAVKDKPGLVETAAGGTLFLDEIGDVPLSVQVKLLRLLQDRTFERVGGTRTIRVDARIIAATNQPLEEMVRKGTFREDLFYRLNVVPITLPPLRERREDIGRLAAFFTDRAGEEHGKAVSLTPESIEALRAYGWPGNVRELENFVERLVILSPGGPVRPENFLLPTAPVHMAHPIAVPEAERSGAAPAEIVYRGRPEVTASLPISDGELTLKKIERAKIIEAMTLAGGIQKKAAKLLGLSRRQLGYRLRQLQIKRDTLSFK